MNRLPVLLAALALAGCEQGYERGDCDPGYLDVNGVCTLAVGGECGSGGDCLSGICVDNPAGGRFCSIACKQHEDCPSGFFCTTWDDRRCYPGQRPPPCQGDDDCAACVRCADGTCQSVPDCRVCNGDDECTSCERCDRGECIQVAGCSPCLFDSQCETCEICAPGGRCERLAGCVLCASDQDCPGCTSCERGACIPIEGCGTEPCFNDPGCPQRTRCLLDATLGLNVCLPVDLRFGDDCIRGGDATCAEGICLKAASGQEAFCSRPCEMDEACPLGFNCEPDDACLWACRVPDVPPPGAGCLNDAGCPEDRVCGLVPGTAGDGWQSRCIAPLPCAGAPGDACGEGTPDRCTTGICTASDHCSPVCAAHADCPAGFLCVLLELPLPDSDLPGRFQGCAPAGSARFEVGQPCPHGDADCLSGLCLAGQANGPRSLCTRACTPGEADCPDRFACLPDPSGGQQDLCQPAVPSGSCSSDGDCQPGQACRLGENDGIPACAAPNPDGAGAGGPCVRDDDCAHGLCLPEGSCAAPCAGSPDCPPGLWCDYRDRILPGGARSWARLCTPDPGSLLVCRRQGDCPAGEVCRPELNPRGTGLDGRCGTTGPGAATGEECLLAAGCANGFCADEGACSAFCCDDEDCPPDLACRTVAVTLPHGAAFSVPGCAP